MANKKVESRPQVADMADAQDEAIAGATEAPQPDEAFVKRTWAGIEEHYECLVDIPHGSARGVYTLPCRRTFFSKDEVLDHIKTDH